MARRCGYTRQRRISEKDEDEERSEKPGDEDFYR